MDQQGAVEYVLALAREHGQPHVDLIVERGERLSLRVLNGQVEKIDHATALGLGIRVVHEGRTGLASSERLEAKALEKTFLAAKENALLNDPTEVVLPEAPVDIPDSQGLGLFNPELEALTVEGLGTLGLDIEAIALQADPRVKAVPHLVVSRSNTAYRIVSTHGVDYHQRQNSVGASCQVLLQDQGRRKSGGYMWAQRAWDPAQGKQIGTIAVGKGMAGLAVERREPVTACNIQTDTSGDVRRGATATGMEGAIVVPILDGDEAVGALGVASSRERTFTDDEIAVLLETGRAISQHR